MNPPRNRQLRTERKNNNMRKTSEIPAEEQLMLIGAAAGIATYICLLEGDSPNKLAETIKGMPERDVFGEILELAVNKQRRKQRNEEGIEH